MRDVTGHIVSLISIITIMEINALSIDDVTCDVMSKPKQDA